MLSDAVRQARINAILVASALANRLFFNRAPLDRDAVRKVMVIETRDLGDAALATVVLEPLRQWLRNAELVMVVGPWARDMFRNSPLIDRIVTYTSDLASNGRHQRISLGKRWREMRELIAEHPDVVIDLRGDFGTVMAAIMSSARHRADRGTWRMRDVWGNVRRRGSVGLSQDVHEADIFREIVQSLGVPAPERRLAILPCAAATAAVEERLARERLGGRPLVVLHPGASAANKMWPAERFGLLAQALAADHEVDFVVTGSDRERDLARAVAGAMRRPPTDLCGGFRLDELTALYRRCALWIGNDTGPMHLAAAAGLPVVVLCGPTSPEKFGPYGTTALVVRSPESGGRGVPGRATMDAITVDHARERLHEFLNSGGVRLPAPQPS